MDWHPVASPTKRGLGARTGCDGGWQPGLQRTWGGRRGGRNQDREEVARSNSLRPPTKASLLDELELGDVMGNPRQGVYFGAVPPDVREEYPEQTATALTYTYLSLSQPIGVRSRVRSIPFELVLGAQLLNKLAHATFHPMWLPPGHPGARGGGG